MPVFSITFDLIKRRDYQTLWVELERLKAQRLLLSHWGVHMATGTTANALRDHLSSYIDNDDALLIVQIDGTEWASWNTLYALGKLSESDNMASASRPSLSGSTWRPPVNQ